MEHSNDLNCAWQVVTPPPPPPNTHMLTQSQQPWNDINYNDNGGEVNLMLKGCLSRVGEEKFIRRCVLKEPSEIASLLGCKNKQFETEITSADIKKTKNGRTSPVLPVPVVEQEQLPLKFGCSAAFFFYLTSTRHDMPKMTENTRTLHLLFHLGWNTFFGIRNLMMMFYRHPQREH